MGNENMKCKNCNGNGEVEGDHVSVPCPNCNGGFIENERTEKPICPYCGYSHKDDWEFDFNGCEGSIAITCHHCSKEFHCQKMCKITYSTFEK